MIIPNSSMKVKNKSATVRAREAKLAMRLLRMKRQKEASETQGGDEDRKPRAEQSKKRRQGSQVKKKASTKKKKRDDADSGKVRYWITIFGWQA